MKMIRKGEYDLVNISFIGFDPVTGRSYEECHAEWSAELERVTSEWAALRWWQVWKNLRLRWEIAALTSRFCSSG